MTPKICMVGSSNYDMISRVPRLLKPGETLAGSSFQTSFGGKGANQAVMAAKLGAQVTVVTKIGRDVFGNDTLRNYHDQGIDTTYLMYDESRSSGVAVITVEESTGQNTIIIVAGANGTLSPDDVRAAQSAIVSADVLMCQLEVPQAATLEALRIARAGGKTLAILNPAPAAPLPDKMLQLADIFAPNEVEAAMLTGMPTDTVEQAAAAGQVLRQRGPKTVVMTLGKRGALLIEGDGQPQHVPAQPVQAVDSSGAGDAFIGSLAYFLGAKLPMRAAVERACAIATRTVLKTGTQTSFPNRDEVADLL